MLRSRDAVIRHPGSRLLGDYSKPIAEEDESFDLLISQYAGFVSRACKGCLRVGGHLLANNSHADASMAALDPDYELVAVYKRLGERFTFSSAELDAYMVPKKGTPPTPAELERSMRGPGFTRAAAGYVFRRVPARGPKPLGLYTHQ